MVQFPHIRGITFHLNSAMSCAACSLELPVSPHPEGKLLGAKMAPAQLPSLVPRHMTHRNCISDTKGMREQLPAPPSLVFTKDSLLRTLFHSRL